MGLIWVNDMGIIGIMRLGTIWIAAVCIVMGLVVIISDSEDGVPVV